MQDAPLCEQRCERTVERRLKSTHALRATKHQEELIVRRQAACRARGGAIDGQFAHWCARHGRLRAAPWRALRRLPPRDRAVRGERRNKGVRSARLYVPLPEQARRARQPRGDPPVEKTTSGRTRRITRIACGIDQRSLAASRAVASTPAPLGRRLGAAKSVNGYPASGTRRDSTPRAPPSQLISASVWSWRTVRATANAGNRCPPVPPPAMSTRITTSCLAWNHRLTRYREEQPNRCHQHNE
jgi:hypothetical protein